MTAKRIDPENWLLSYARHCLASGAKSGRKVVQAAESLHAMLSEGALILYRLSEPGGMMLQVALYPTSETCLWDGRDVLKHVSEFIKRQGDGRFRAMPFDSLPIDPDIAKCFPTLYWWMSASYEGNGKRRKTAVLSWSYESGTVRMYIRDRNNQHMLWVNAATVNGAMEVMDAALASDDPQWRRDRYSGGDSGRVNPKMGG